MTNKVIIFLVEGPTDKGCFGAIVNKFDNLKNNYRFEYESTKDLTSNYKIKESGIKKKICDIINSVLKRNGYRWGDIERIVQVVDLDGTYIPNDRIVQDVSKYKFFYTEDCIRNKNIDEVSKRNGHKKKILETLINTKQINGCKYDVYFMSCNLEHVLWGSDYLNATDRQKVDLYKDFLIKCSRSADILNETIFNPAIRSKEFSSSWLEVKNGCNSLRRKTNINLFFDEYV